MSPFTSTLNFNYFYSILVIFLKYIYVFFGPNHLQLAFGFQIVNKLFTEAYFRV